jgi:hypothetical protein
MKLRLSLVILGFALWAMPALGQACAMCYSTAAAASKDGQRAINRAILILLVPPLGFMTAGVGFALRYGKKRDCEHPEE